MNISFKGLANTKYVADQQKGEDCWLEALENVVQLYYGDVAGNLNHLSDYLRHAMIQDHYDGYDPVRDNVKSPMKCYPDILACCGIETKWHILGKGTNEINQFNHNALIQMLDQHRVALARVDIKHLPNYGGQSGNHAIVITDYVIDANQTLFYHGLDSNFETQEQYWRADHLQTALNYKDSALFGQGQLLITNQSARWPHKTVRM